VPLGAFYKIEPHGSSLGVTGRVRGKSWPWGGVRDDYDLDLSCLVDSRELETAEEKSELLHCVLDISLKHWKAPVELGAAVVFDRKEYGLVCFNHRIYKEGICRLIEDDCEERFLTLVEALHLRVPFGPLAIKTDRVALCVFHSLFLFRMCWDSRLRTAACARQAPVGRIGNVRHGPGHDRLLVIGALVSTHYSGQHPFDSTVAV
jgi:hypothetical protein